jgi:hypothetical protein
MSQDAPPPLADLSDGDLLRLFVKGRDESAFRVVVDRHGPLGDEPASEFAVEWTRVLQ